MAVDTQEKRMSAAGAGRPFIRSAFPTSIDEQWRVGRGIAYNGNALTAVVIVYTNVHDAIRGAVVGDNINDGLRTWFSATADEHLHDAERRWLLAFPSTTGGSNQDMWMEYLNSLGYTGSLNDRLLQYWQNQ